MRAPRWPNIRTFVAFILRQNWIRSDNAHRLVHIVTRNAASIESQLELSRTRRNFLYYIPLSILLTLFLPNNRVPSHSYSGSSLVLTLCVDHPFCTFSFWKYRPQQRSVKTPWATISADYRYHNCDDRNGDGFERKRGQREIVMTASVLCDMHIERTRSQLADGRTWIMLTWFMTRAEGFSKFAFGQWETNEYADERARPEKERREAGGEVRRKSRLENGLMGSRDRECGERRPKRARLGRANERITR